jgi:DNA-binding MarR family transcriptional regulator
MTSKECGLSKNEQLVLYHLVKYPTYADHDIYERIGMKQSTYSTIKKKLAEEGFYFTTYAPILQHLGTELLVVWYVTLNRKTRTEERLSLTRDALLKAEDLVCVVSESNQAILISMSKNISEHVKLTDNLVKLYEEHDFLEELHQVLFPFDVSSVFTFFDFAPLLNRLFKIESPEESAGNVDPGSEGVRCRVKHTELNELEKKVYLGLIKHPNLSDTQLSDKLGCSRQVFSRLRHRFMEDKLIKKRNIVSMERLNFKMLAMTHTKFDPLKVLSERQACTKMSMETLTPIFKIARDPECVMINAFKDFEEFKRMHNEFVYCMTGYEAIREDPKNVLLSIPRIFEIKWLVYESLVKKVLDGI